MISFKLKILISTSISLIFCQIHFSELPDSTGVYQPIVIEECFGLDIGDEIGLFDASGLLSNDCSNQYGEILVGSGVYNGEQITISGFGSIDYCDLNDGYQLAGWINNNSIQIKVWDRSENIEYIPDVNYTVGSGNWGDIYTVIDMLIVNELSMGASDYFSLYKAYPNPFNSTITFSINKSLTHSLDVLIFDISGKFIEKLDLNPSYSNQVSWDASNYKSGIYLVNFTSSKAIITKKISLIK